MGGLTAQARERNGSDGNETSRRWCARDCVAQPRTHTPAAEQETRGEPAQGARARARKRHSGDAVSNGNDDDDDDDESDRE